MTAAERNLEKRGNVLEETDDKGRKASEPAERMQMLDLYVQRKMKRRKGKGGGRGGSI